MTTTRDVPQVSARDIYKPLADMLGTRFKTPDTLPLAWPHGYQATHYVGSIVLYRSSAPMLPLDYDVSLYYERGAAGRPTGLLLTPTLALASTELDGRIVTPQQLMRMADHCGRFAAWLRTCAAAADALRSIFPDVPFDKGTDA